MHSFDCPYSKPSINGGIFPNLRTFTKQKKLQPEHAGYHQPIPKVGSSSQESSVLRTCLKSSGARIGKRTKMLPFFVTSMLRKQTLRKKRALEGR